MLHQLFFKAVRKNHDYFPVLIHESNENNSISYKELSELINQCAHYLRDVLGIQKQDCVIVKTNREDATILLLALSLIGAIYVPVDPASSVARLKTIANSCKPKIIITDQKIEKIDNIKTISLIDAKKEIEQQSTKLPTRLANDEDAIAFIIYTSGTTGKPKAIPIAHKGLTYWFNYLRELLYDPNTVYPPRVLGFISISFDAHIWELLMAFSIGGALCIPTKQTREDFKKLTDFMRASKITHATLLPSILRIVTNEIDALTKSGLNTVFTTGEACTPDIVQKCYPKIKFYNAYGSTECTFGLFLMIITPKDIHEGKYVPIGLPYGKEIKYYILDANGQPLTNDEIKQGLQGELVISSPYLFGKYLNDPEKTKQAFTEITINGKKIRVYKTGDRVFYRKSLYYVGRANVNSHIKINAKYFSLPDIERPLRQLPEIQDVSAVSIKGSSQEDILVIFYVLKPKEVRWERKERKQIKKNLRKTLLDEFGIPAILFRKINLPLTTNGKVDLKTLEEDARALYKQLPKNTKKTKHNTTSLSQSLMKIWKEVLNIPSIEYNDEFKELGGDSLAINRLAREINQRYKIDISLFELMSVSQLTLETCYKIVRSKLLLNASGLSPIHPTVRSPNINVFFLPPLLGGHIFYHELGTELFKQNLSMNIYTLTEYEILQLEGIIGLSKKESALTTEEILEEYYTPTILDKMRQQPNAFLILIGWSNGGILASKIANQLNEKYNITIGLLCLIDTKAPSVYQTMSESTFNQELDSISNTVLNYPYIEAMTNKDEIKKKLNFNKIKTLDKVQQINEIFDTIFKHLDLAWQRCTTEKEKERTRTILAMAKTKLLETLKLEPKKNQLPTLIISSNETVNKVNNDQTLGWLPVCEKLTSFTTPADHFSILSKKSSYICECIIKMLIENEDFTKIFLTRTNEEEKTDFENELNRKTIHRILEALLEIKKLEEETRKKMCEIDTKLDMLISSTPSPILGRRKTKPKKDMSTKKKMGLFGN